MVFHFAQAVLGKAVWDTRFCAPQADRHYPEGATEDVHDTVLGPE